MVQKTINQSIIYCILINPSSYITLSQYLTHPILAYQTKYFTQTDDDFVSLLIKMNPLLEDIIEEEYEKNTEKENEINSIVQEDNLEVLKKKIINHLLNIGYKDGKGISLIERCVFFNSENCINFLLEENVLIERHNVRIGYKNYEIGLMEYGALKGNQNIINICLEKGQKIQELTIQLGLIAHHNKIVEWMIEEGKQRKHFKETIETQILGFTDNIEFNEKLLKSGININAKNNNERRRYKELLHYI